MGVTQNLAGFFVARFFLGVTESGLFPGVVFYLSMWYKRNEQHYRLALSFSAASLAGAFGGILAWVSVTSCMIISLLPTYLDLGHSPHERCRRTQRMAVDFHPRRHSHGRCFCGRLWFYN